MNTGLTETRYAKLDVFICTHSPLALSRGLYDCIVNEANNEVHFLSGKLFVYHSK